MPPRRTLAVIIPCRNEHTVLPMTLSALVRLLSPQDIFVIDDGSRRPLRPLAKAFGVNYHRLPRNLGKAQALNFGIHRFRLSYRYRLVMPLDADTRLEPDFITHLLPHFRGRANRSVIAVVGQIRGQITNGYTAYRLWEYAIGQAIHKAAQSKLGAILVCPGCATVYRSELFDRVTIPSDTLAEDMDFTFTLHRLGIGDIRYEPQAKVITQDPQTFPDFRRQITRWYTGYWQALFKHHFPWGGQPIDLEVALLSTDGLFNALFTWIIIITLPLSLALNKPIFLSPLLVDLALFIFPTFLLTRFTFRLRWLFRYLPLIYLLRFYASLTFFMCFIKVVLAQDRRVVWHTPARYLVKV